MSARESGSTLASVTPPISGLAGSAVLTGDPLTDRFLLAILSLET